MEHRSFPTALHAATCDFLPSDIYGTLKDAMTLEMHCKGRMEPHEILVPDLFDFNLDEGDQLKGALREWAVKRTIHWWETVKDDCRVRCNEKGLNSSQTVKFERLQRQWKLAGNVADARRLFELWLNYMISARMMMPDESASSLTLAAEDVGQQTRNPGSSAVESAAPVAACRRPGKSGVLCQASAGSALADFLQGTTWLRDNGVPERPSAVDSVATPMSQLRRSRSSANLDEGRPPAKAAKIPNILIE